MSFRQHRQHMRTSCSLSSASSSYLHLVCARSIAWSGFGHFILRIVAFLGSPCRVLPVDRQLYIIWRTLWSPIRREHIVSTAKGSAASPASRSIPRWAQVVFTPFSAMQAGYSNIGALDHSAGLPANGEMRGMAVVCAQCPSWAEPLTAWTRLPNGQPLCSM